MTHIGKRSQRRRHLQLVGVDGLKPCCNAHRERAKRDYQLLLVTTDGITEGFSSCPTCRTLLVIQRWPARTEEDLPKLEDDCTIGAGAGFGKYTREMSNESSIQRKPLEMSEERVAGEVLPRLETTTAPRPWWQTKGALALAVALLLVAAVVVGATCRWMRP